MKKIFMFLAAAMMAVNVLADPIEIELTKLDTTGYGADYMYSYSNEDYKVSLDVYTNFPRIAGEKYHLNNVDPDYSQITDLHTYRRYAYTELEFVFGANMVDVEVTATGVCHNPGTDEDEFITIHAVYEEKEMTPISLGLFGSYEYLEYSELKIYQFKASTMMGDPYSVDIPVLADELVLGSTYSIEGGTIHKSAAITTPSGDVVLDEAELELTYLELEQMYLLAGTLKDKNGQVYNVQIAANLPEGPENIELSFYNTVLSNDEGDIKFKYENKAYQLTCYLEPKEGDDLESMTLAGGEYNILSYSKFGLWNEELSIYMADALADAHALVEVDEEATVLTLTFSQNGEAYTITASTGEQPKIVVEQSELAIYDWSAPEYTIVTMAYPTDWTFQMTIVAEDGLAEGEYELGEYDNVQDADYMSYNFVQGSKITLSKGTDWKGDDCWIISGELETVDGKIFDITLSTAPAKADENLEKVVAENATVVCNFRTNKWSIEAAFGTESKDTIRLQFANTEYAGEYSEDWHFGWNNVLVYGEGVADEVETASLKAEVEGDDIHVTGWIIFYSYGTDLTYYVPVDLKGAMVEEDPAKGDEQSDLTVTLETVTLEDYGWNFDFSASNEEGYELVLKFSWGVELEDGKLPVGELPISADDDIDARIIPSIEIPEGGYGPGPLSLEDEGEEMIAVPDGSYITDGEKFWFLYEGSATVAYNEDGALQMVINAKNTAGNVLTITIDEDLSITGCENAEAAVKVVKTIENGQLIINRDGEKYNVVGAKL